jgi:superfamily I DNA/RNA helicase
LKTGGFLWRASKYDVRFSTISSFKGLEAKIVILADVDGFSDNDIRLLNYVAISRAVSKLFILYNINAESERQQMILSGFKHLQH